MNYEPTINHYEQRLEKAQGEKTLTIAKQINRPVAYFPQGFSPAWQKMKDALKARMEKQADGGTVPKKPVKKKDSQRDINKRRAIELYQSGKNLTEITAIMGLSRSYTNELLRGVAVREKASKTNKQRAFEMHANGMSVKEIGEQLGLHRETVRFYLRQLAK